MSPSNVIDAIVARANRAWSRPSWWNLLIVLPWVVGVVFMIHEWRTDTQVAWRQHTTSGLVIAHDVGNHNQYGYRFQVDGKSYTGWQSPQRDELTIGKKVRVFYDPHDPSRNSLIDFRDASTLSLGPVPMLLFGIGAVGVFIFYRRRKMAHQQEKSS